MFQVSCISLCGTPGVGGTPDGFCPLLGQTDRDIAPPPTKTPIKNLATLKPIHKPASVGPPAFTVTTNCGGYYGKDHSSVAMRNRCFPSELGYRSIRWLRQAHSQYDRGH